MSALDALTVAGLVALITFGIVRSRQGERPRCGMVTPEALIRGLPREDE